MNRIDSAALASQQRANAPQHHDHIWLTVHGEAWAIQAIERPEPGVITLHLWRGFAPNLEMTTVALENPDWAAYCDAAVEMMRLDALGQRALDGVAHLINRKR